MAQREIKFRVWNGSKMEHKVMAGFLGSFYVQGMDEKDTACMSPFNTKYFPETPLMQYTGLKDKQGKDIYVGDIVKCEGSKYNFVGVIKWSQQACQYWVTWFIPETVSRYKELIATGGGDYYSADYTEVIGNIYETPELLEPIS